MVVVTNDPYPETEPMLGAATSEVTNIPQDPTVENAYKNITSSMKADPLQITSPRLALDLLLTAVKLLNMPLVKQCIEILDLQLDKKIALTILSHLSKCKMPASTKNDFQPSAPPIVDNENQRHKDWVQDLTDHLRHNCLLEIDKHADYVLRQKEFLDLSYNDILAITTRDTLQVSSEVYVYSAIMKWATEECRRRTLQPYLLNIKAVLRELVYAPRYGLMSKKEFMARRIEGEKGPVKSGILDEKEWRRVLFFIKERSKNRPVEELPFKGSQSRVIGNEKPKILSSRSAARGMECPTRDNTCGTRGRWERCLINFLTCWTAVFD